MIDPDHGTGKIQYVLVTLLRECYDKFYNNIIHLASNRHLSQLLTTLAFRL